MSSSGNPRRSAEIVALAKILDIYFDFGGLLRSCCAHGLRDFKIEFERYKLKIDVSNDESAARPGRLLF